MKKHLFSLMTIAFYFAINSVNAQKLPEPDPKYYLPGNDYGLGLIIPEFPHKGDPGGRPPSLYDADLAVEMVGEPRITQTACKDYFTVDFKVRATNFDSTYKITTVVYPEDKYVTSDRLQPGAISTVNAQPVVLDPLQSKIINVHFTMYYPYLIQLSDRSRQYKKFPYQLSATIITAFQTDHPHTFIRDTNEANDRTEKRKDTPLPGKCEKTPPRTE